MGSEKASASNTKKAARQQSTPKAQKTAPPPKPVTPQFTPPMGPMDDIYQHEYGRERSQTPPMFPYSAYPPPEEVLINPYGAAQPYPTMTSAESYPTYLATAMPVTLPSMTHFNDAIKNSSDGLSPYMHYGFMPSIDINASNAYDHSNPHVSYSRNLSLARDTRC